MLFDVGKYGENIAFEHAKGIAVTYNDLAKLTKRVEQKIGSRKLVCLLASNTVGALAYYISFLKYYFFLCHGSGKIDHLQQEVQQLFVLK